MDSTLQLQQLNGFYKMVPETDRAYIAGLFDGEGSIHFKRGIEKRRNTKVNLDIEYLTLCALVWK